ncbi:MAG TPA: Ku protein [Candidatus Methanoperedens sp.]|nr:Ku protein [Candidatus Methanoperedens sp.]HLB71903.1 Ku protein [Candidatus Methanoperedens sp.]
MAKEKSTAKPSSRSIWSGSITIGLVNVPVKLYTMIRDQSFSFRLLHNVDGQPLKYERVCIRDEKVIDWKDTVKGYEIRKNEFIVFKKEELDAIRPESDERIKLDKFISLLSIDPVYFEKSYILVPDRSEEAYSLLMTVIRQEGKAGLGKVTLRTKEYPAIVYAYKGALILTTLHYANEVTNPVELEELTKLKNPSKNEMELAGKIIKELSGEFDITEYRDGYRERIEKLIQMKMKGEIFVAQVPKKEEVKELMVALQETIKQLAK